MLLGGARGDWQRKAALHVQGPASLHSYRTPVILLTEETRFTRAQLVPLLECVSCVAAWCGADTDCWYLEEWIWIGYALGIRKPILTGCAVGVEHPMLASLEIQGTPFAVFCDRLTRFCP